MAITVRNSPWSDAEKMFDNLLRHIENRQVNMERIESEREHRRESRRIQEDYYKGMTQNNIQSILNDKDRN